MSEKHIFVVSNGTLNTCQYLKDLQITTPHACDSLAVRLEPLVHWGTVTPATASHHVFAFRRDGELMQQPEYIQLVKRLVDTEVPTYCFDCLHCLWSKRAEAQETMTQLQCAVRQPDSCESEEAIRLQTQLRLKDIGGTSGDAKAPDLSKGVRSASNHTEQAVGPDVYMHFERVGGAFSIPHGD